MLTRRSMMLASIAAGVIMNNRTVSAKAAPDAAIRKKILVDNPAQLYGF